MVYAHETRYVIEVLAEAAVAPVVMPPAVVTGLSALIIFMGEVARER